VCVPACVYMCMCVCVRVYKCEMCVRMCVYKCEMCVRMCVFVCVHMQGHVFGQHSVQARPLMFVATWHVQSVGLKRACVQ
jgi:hypothetical protein